MPTQRRIKKEKTIITFQNACTQVLAVEKSSLISRFGFRHPEDLANFLNRTPAGRSLTTELRKRMAILKHLEEDAIFEKQEQLKRIRRILIFIILQHIAAKARAETQNQSAADKLAKILSEDLEFSDTKSSMDDAIAEIQEVYEEEMADLQLELTQEQHTLEQLQHYTVLLDELQSLHDTLKAHLTHFPDIEHPLENLLSDLAEALSFFVTEEPAENTENTIRSPMELEAAFKQLKTQLQTFLQNTQATTAMPQPTPTPTAPVLKPHVDSHIHRITPEQVQSVLNSQKQAVENTKAAHTKLVKTIESQETQLQQTMKTIIQQYHEVVQAKNTELADTPRPSTAPKPRGP